MHFRTPKMHISRHLSPLPHYVIVTNPPRILRHSSPDVPSYLFADNIDHMLIAALGDVHGRWREAADLVVVACAEAGVDTKDLAMILQAGDAEPLRNEDEITQVPGPSKYRRQGDFPEVMSGEIVMPAPLYFVAGNHEPFAALDADGGLINGHGVWGPDVFYLGRAGALTIDGLRIGFISGIYGESTYVRSMDGRLTRRVGKHASHYTAQELDQVQQAVRAGVDVILTHDWPAGITEDSGRYGDIGDPRVRTLIESSGAMLSIHGHMHVARRATIHRTQVACLAIVGSRSSDPLAAVGVWNIDHSGGSAGRLA